MKKIMRIGVGVMLGMFMQSTIGFTQKIDEQRMYRDIEVAENVLTTLFKQELNQQRTFFGLEIKGTYQEGHGVMFRLPGDYNMPYFYSTPEARGGVYYRDDARPLTIIQGSANGGDDVTETYSSAPKGKDGDSQNLKDKALEKNREKRKVSLDSARDAFDNVMIKVSKEFIVDYGDFISQLGANERIVLTNQGENNRGGWFKDNKRKLITVEASKTDIASFKQGKISRDQMLSKITVINKEYVDSKEPDMELLASIFNRLYSSDLSKTFFSSNSVYYERLKDYGVVFNMQVYSSQANNNGFVMMPTQGLESVDQETRDKKVKELYPQFEQDLKENIVEYGRTLKSLKDDEVFVFNITLTKCKDCGIPSSLEYSIKASVLRDFGAGKLDRNSAITKITVKKGVTQ